MGKSWGMGFGPSPSNLGAQVGGEGPGGVCWHLHPGCILLMTFLIFC